VPQPLRAIWDYAVQVFAMLGAVSLVVWLVSIAAAKHHRPLDFWLVACLALFLVAALIWGYRRGRPAPASAGQTVIHGDQYNIYQIAPGTVPEGAPPAPPPEANA